MNAVFKLKQTKWLLLLVAIAGLLYNSWPLGYILNNHTATNFLASNLEATGQPYSWLFILGDIITGLLIMAVGVYYWRHQKTCRSWLFKVTIFGFVSFGLITIVSAMLPFNCQQSVYQCSVQLTTSFGIHDIVGAIGSIGQCFSLYGALRISLINYRSHHLHELTFLAGFALWCASGLYFLIASLTNATLAIFIQHFFIILSGVGLVLIPLALDFKQKNNSSEVS